MIYQQERPSTGSSNQNNQISSSQQIPRNVVNSPRNQDSYSVSPSKKGQRL